MKKMPVIFTIILLVVTDLCSADFTKMTDKLQFLRSHIYNEDKFEKL